MLIAPLPKKWKNCSSRWVSCVYMYWTGNLILVFKRKWQKKKEKLNVAVERWHFLDPLWDTKYFSRMHLFIHLFSLSFVQLFKYRFLGNSINHYNLHRAWSFTLHQRKYKPTRSVMQLWTVFGLRRKIWINHFEGGKNSPASQLHSRTEMRRMKNPRSWFYQNAR